MSNPDWTEINEPLLEMEGFIDAILDKIDILSLLDTWEVKYSICRTGEFSHRSKCPFPQHFFGDERTPSFFISESQNKFYCFGCNSGGSAIDFVKLYSGKPFYEAAKWLAKYAGLTSDNVGDLKSIIRKKVNPEHKVSTHVFRAGVEIRKHLNNVKGKKEYTKWCNWANKRFDQLDKYLEELNDDDWEIAKAYYDKIAKHLERKL